MTLRYYYQNNDGDVVELVDAVRRRALRGSSQGEEGAVGTWDLEVDDPEGTFNIRGFRLVYAQEDEAIADAQHGIVGVWYTGERYISRMGTDLPNKRTEAARTWRISLHDINTRLSWRMNIGNDTDRPDGETDLETVEWLMSTNEMAFVDNDTTYIDTTDGVEMSENRDYQGQTLLDVLDDCAQTSSRNYGLLWEYSGDEDSPIAIKLWYKFAASEDYTSTKYINNRLEFTNLSETGDADVLAPSLDAELNRSPSRVAWGVNQLYDGGSTYQTKQLTADRFAKVDVTGRGENIKSEAKAIARAQRYLNTVSNQETDRITVSVEVSLADANSILPFMRIPVHFEHLPGYGTLDEYSNPEYHYMRVVERTIRDDIPNIYILSLTLQNDALDDLTVPGPEYDDTLQAYLLGISGPYPVPAGDLFWDRTGDEVGWPPSILTNGPFTFVSSGYSWPPWEGIEITADGTLHTITLVGSYIGVAIGANEPYTVTMELLKNGVSIGTPYTAIVTADGASSLAANPWVTVTASDVPVSTGDVISGRLSCLPVAMEMFRAPLGINPGVGWNRLEIRGGDF